MIALPDLVPAALITLEEFHAQIQQEFCQGSAISPAVFGAAVTIEPDLIQRPGGEIETPIHDALNWQYKRFRHQANGNQYAALMRQEIGSCWQAKLAKRSTSQSSTT